MRAPRAVLTIAAVASVALLATVGFVALRGQAPTDAIATLDADETPRTNATPAEVADSGRLAARDTTVPAAEPENSAETPRASVASARRGVSEAPVALPAEHRLLIHVRSSDDATHDLHGAYVSVTELFESSVHCFEQEDGTYLTDPLVPGEYDVHAGGPNLASSQRRVALLPTDGVKDVVMTLDHGAPIRVRWLTPGGASIMSAIADIEIDPPRVGLSVYATREPPSEQAPPYEGNSGALLIAATARTRGAKSADRPVETDPKRVHALETIGTLMPHIARPYYLSAWLDDTYVDVRRIEAGTDEVTFVSDVSGLEARRSTLKLHAVDADTDKSIADAHVSIDVDGQSRALGGADADGRFLFTDLRPGAIAVWVDAPGHMRRGEQAILRPNMVTDLGDVRLETPIKVSVRVLDEQGTLLPFVRIDLTPVDDHLEPIAGLSTQSLTTPATGIAVLQENVRRVRYVARIAQVLEQFAAAPVLIDARSGSAEGQLVLAAAHHVAITLHPAPEEGAFVRITTRDGLLANRKKVGEGGQVAVSLANGTYDLALVEGGAPRVLKRFDVDAPYSVLDVAR